MKLFRVLEEFHVVEDPEESMDCLFGGEMSHVYYCAAQVMDMLTSANYASRQHAFFSVEWARREAYFSSPLSWFDHQRSCSQCNRSVQLQKTPVSDLLKCSMLVFLPDR